jgi:hypothetical protein
LVKRRGSGQGTVEFALIAPTFFVLLFMIMEAALFINAQVTIDNATREAARVAGLCGSSKAAAVTGVCSAAYSGAVQGGVIQVDVAYDYTYWVHPLLGSRTPKTTLASRARVVSQQ